MSTTPLATIAMVTYNSSAYVAQAIESVLCQSYENLELLICDDYSSDNTRKIVQNYSDTRIRVILNEQNLGEYANRNQAARLARGKYLIYIDGDDILYPHGLEFMVRMLEAFPNSAMAIARPWNEKIIYPVEFSPRQMYLSEYLGGGNIAINFAHVLFRTAVLQEVGGIDTRYKTGDAWIQLRIARDHPCLLISDGLAWWRRTPGQSSEALLRNHASWPEYYQYRMEFLMHEDCPLTKEESNIAISNIYSTSSRLILKYILKGRIGYARKLIKKSKFPLRAWKFIRSSNLRNHLVEVNAGNPLFSEMKKNPFARFTEGEHI